MPPTRREQLELDELLSDIYRGIETLPDKSSSAKYQQFYQPTSSGNKSSLIHSRTLVKEYELPASSPLVKQHKQELAALRQQQQPQRSTLKRHTNTPDQQQHPAQSLASFVTSTTPENKRRVRILDHPDKLAKGYDSYDDNEEINNNTSTNQKAKPGGKVKYVNTNKLIYHQEHNPDDDQLSDSDENNNNNQDNNNDDDDDIDGVTRVEYYHTTWLDRQLGRASKRRSSKELNERQVKEKAMIEELKRSLKNGAITLRQSFKGKKQGNKHAHKANESFDDHMLEQPKKTTSYYNDNNNNNNHDRSNRISRESSSVFGSGLATIPRNYHNNNNNNNLQSASKQEQRHRHQTKSNSDKFYNSTGSNTLATPKQTSKQQQQSFDDNNNNNSIGLGGGDGSRGSSNQPMQTRSSHQPGQPVAAANYSRTLPHNYNKSGSSSVQQQQQPHQLLQSHYNKNFNTLNAPSPTSASSRQVNTIQQVSNRQPVDNNINMRNPNYTNGSNCNTSGNLRDRPKSPLFQQQQQAQTISGIPSATEVVRSALSRSGSQVSLNQLNKTINLLPNSPPPYAPSPMTPTQQLKPASPSLSPSPIRSPQSCLPGSHYNSKTLASSPSAQAQQRPLLQGTRTVGRPPQVQHQQQYQPQAQAPHQPVYANPHASLMQHRIEQQMRQPGRSNNASIREFNELDSLLRSLSPGSVHVAPGYSSKPSQPAFGFGFSPAQPQQQQPQYQPQQQLPRGPDIYAKVQKQPASIYNQPTIAATTTPATSEQTKASYLQQHYGATNTNLANNQTNQPFTIDVTNIKNEDENCVAHQNLSEFEPPIELLPSMEDYQNITKLNPVKNHYWYKPNMSRDRAINLLKDKPQGTFIVRDSTSFKGAFGLAVKVSKLPKNVLNNANLRNPVGDPSAELIRHFLIEPTSNGVRLKGYANEPVFGSLPNLIYQHSLTELALPCKLVIPRADIEDPNFNHKQKQFYDEFLSSKEQAKHSPYELTSPNGGYRKYPGDVYVHNEHRIIFE